MSNPEDMKQWREERRLTREEALELKRVLRFLRKFSPDLLVDIAKVREQQQDIELRWERLCYWAGIKPEYYPDEGAPQTRGLLDLSDVTFYIDLVQPHPLSEQPSHWERRLWGHVEKEPLFSVRIERGAWRYKGEST